MPKKKAPGLRTPTPKSRSSQPTQSETERLACLRLIDRTPTDWTNSAEGWLLLYDPAIVTEQIWCQLNGVQDLCLIATQWMLGGDKTIPAINQPEHWRGFSRRELGKSLALLTELAWNCSLTILPMSVAWNGADVRLRSGSLTPEEIKQREQAFRPKHLKHKLAPCNAYLSLSQDRVALTWDFLLGFSGDKKQELFEPGYEIICDWPRGDYHLTGWQFPEIEDDETGIAIDQFVIQPQNCELE